MDEVFSPPEQLLPNQVEVLIEHHRGVPNVVGKPCGDLRSGVLPCGGGPEHAVGVTAGLEIGIGMEDVAESAPE